MYTYKEIQRMKTVLPVVRTIDPNFQRWLLELIQIRTNYVIDHTSQNIQVEDLFEALVPEQYWDVLRKVRMLLDTRTYQSNYVDLICRLPTYGSIVEVIIQFNHLTEQHTIILPTITKLNPLEPNTKLMEYLTPSLSLMRDWVTLHKVVSELMKMTNNRDALASMFPWLPDIIRESGWILIPDETAKQVDPIRLDERIRWYKNKIGVENKVERYNCDRTFIAALKRNQPAPFLHKNVREAALSGSRLMTQYRLTKQIVEENTKSININNARSVIKPVFHNNLILDNVIVGLGQTKELYDHERGRT